MQSNDETELIAQSLDGNHEAYGILVDRYKKAVYHHCFAIMRDEAAAEDIAQEAFIAAFYKLHQYKRTYKFSTWLFKIATNKALDELRKVKPARIDVGMEQVIPSSQVSLMRRAEYSELHTAVARLKPKYRAIVSLYYWQGLTYQEVAVALSIPEGSVKGWMSRAKDELRKELS